MLLMGASCNKGHLPAALRSVVVTSTTKGITAPDHEQHPILFLEDALIVAMTQCGR